VRVLLEDDVAGVGEGLLSIGDGVLLGVMLVDVVPVDEVVVEAVFDDVVLVAVLLLLLLDDKLLV
jgi:hypothetical protein